MTTRQKEFIDLIAPLAVKGANLYSFPFPSVCIAQAIHESGFGKSTLAINNYNYFGIKLNHSGISDIYTVGSATEEVNGKDVTTEGTKWAKFHSVYDGVLGYYRYLTVWTHYAPAFEKKTWQECLKHISKTYATRSTYYDQVASIVVKYNLTQYDSETAPIDVDWKYVKKGDTVTTIKDYPVGLSESKVKKGIYAKNRDGSTKVYPKGNYYVYKVSGECVNISKSKLLPGGWILP